MKLSITKILFAALGIAAITAPLAASADTLGVGFFDRNGNVTVRAGYDNFGAYHADRDDRNFYRNQAIRRDERFDRWQADRFERERIERARIERERFDREHRYHRDWDDRR